MDRAKASLSDRLCKVIPGGTNLEYYHISTPPTRCAALYNPPQNSKPEKTFRESQSLVITAPSGRRDNTKVAIFAIEIQIYTTIHLTTVFISKADSTGFATLLDIPKSSGSLLQNITSTFVSWIIQHRQVSDRRLVLSLFARAQDQYLFPGSVENEEKHVLDDRQLVKWWCKTLDPVLREYAPGEPFEKLDKKNTSTASTAYLVVPGHDKYETLSFFPQTARMEPAASRRWIADHPLLQLAPEATAPPRCLVPHFPDDPKSRYLDQLDEEISDIPSGPQTKIESPSKRRGHWRSIKTLEQFWDAMSFRQECSSGRLVGFLWIVFTPPEVDASADHHTDEYTPAISLKRKSDANHEHGDDKKRSKTNQVKKRLIGPIPHRASRVKQAPDAQKSPIEPFPEKTQYFYIPTSTRGRLLIPSKSYDRLHEILLRLDFTGIETAAESTQKWIEETAVIAGQRGLNWGIEVRGSKATTLPAMVVQANGIANGIVNVLQSSSSVSNGTTGIVNVLAVKKKPKMQNVNSVGPAVSLIGKKPNPEAKMGPN